MKLMLNMIFVVLLQIRHVRPEQQQQQQDFLDTAYSNQEDESNKVSLTGPTNHPYVGIPVTNWKIMDLNITEKESVCVDQLRFCANECNGEQLVTKNFCNRNTMGWNCVCQNHVPDIPPYGWPISLAECKGKEAACNHQCTYGTTQDVCLRGCSRYFKCNKPGGPKSGLKVDDEHQTPNYNLPVADDGNDTSAARHLQCTKHSTLAYLCFGMILIIRPSFYGIIILTALAT